MTQPSPAPVPPPNNPVPGWLLLLLAVGGPTAAAATFTNQFTSNPLQFAGLTLVYLIALALVGALTKIWQNLEPRWIGPVADRIDRAVRTLIAGYRRRYLTYLTEQHRFFDVKGLTTQGPYSLRLEQVFVELSLAAETARRSTANPIAVPDSLSKGQHTLWDFLQARQLQDQHLVIIGAPGSGKTTLLRHMALAFAAKGRARPRGKQPKKLPILLFLRDHADAIKADPKLTLAQAVRDHLSRLHGPPPPPEWFERQLDAGGCLVMLDGLDEVADPKARKQVVAWVERQMTAHAKNRFLITSRPFGYRSNPLERVTLLEVRPFTQTQVERFIHNWYLANEIMSARLDDPGVRRAARLGGEDLLQRLRNAASLADLAVNPLLLTMIANVHRYRSTLPGRRVELYAEIFEVFLGKRQQARGIDLDLTPAQKQSVLQPLAYALMQRQQRELAVADALPIIRGPLERVSIGMGGAAFLKQIEDSSGLLLERESGVYSFAHLTFQEYLAAAHVREQHLEAELVRHVAASWWHETLRLYSAQADASAIIDACVADAQPPVEALTLALECAEEARLIEPAARQRLDAVVSTGLEDRDPARYTPIAEALLALRLRRMVRLDEERAIDTAPLTCAEYQLFLDERYAQGQAHQPDHWSELVFPKGQAHSPVVGMRHSDAQAFCDWLTQRGGEWCYRLLTTQELKDQARNITIDDSGCCFWAHEGCMHEATSFRISTAQLQHAINQRLALDWQQIRWITLSSITEIRDLALAHKLTIALAQYLAESIERDLTRDVYHIRISIGMFASTNIHLPLDSTLNNAYQIASKLVNILLITRGFTDIESVVYIREVAQNLAQNLTSAYDLTYSLIRTITREHDLDIAHNLIQEFARIKKHINAFICIITSIIRLNNTIEEINRSTPTKTNIQTFNLISDLSRDITHHLNNISNIPSQTKSKSPHNIHINQILKYRGIEYTFTQTMLKNLTHNPPKLQINNRNEAIYIQTIVFSYQAQFNTPSNP